mgnify:CR=1 FL=1
MKKAADYIAVSAFFVIVIMFAAYTLVMGRHGSESEKDIKKAVDNLRYGN